MLLLRILQLDPDSRITTSQMSQHFWLTKMGEFPLPDKKGVNLTEEMELELATIMREKLELHHLTPTAILDYVNSRSGCSGRTAGCFNILAQEKTLRRSELEEKKKRIVDRLLVGESSGIRVNRSNNEQALVQLAPSVKMREDNWTKYNREDSTRVSKLKRRDCHEKKPLQDKDINIMQKWNIQNNRYDEDKDHQESNHVKPPCDDGILLDRSSAKTFPKTRLMKRLR